MNKERLTVMQEIIINSLNELDEFASKLSSHLKPGDVLLLDGDLGAGKTTLTQFIAKHLGIEDTVNSPTFTIMKMYETSEVSFIHIDAYRLEGTQEDLGWNEVFDGHSIVVVEWSQYIADELPLERLRISIEQLGEHQRKLVCSIEGEQGNRELEGVLK